MTIAYISFSRAESLAIDSRLKSVSETVNLIDININSTNKLISQTLTSSSDSTTIKYLIRNITNAQAQNMNDIVLTTENIDYLNQVFQELGNSSKLQLFNGDNLLEISKCEDIFDPANESKLIFDILHLSEQQKTYYTNILDRSKINDHVIFFGVYPESVEKYDLNQRYIVAADKVENTNSETDVILALIPAERYYRIIPISMGLLQDQTIFIIDRDNTLICSDKTPRPQLLNEVTVPDNTGVRSSTIFLENTEYHITHQYNGLTGWHTYSVMNSERIFPQANTLRNFIITVAIIILIVTIILFAILTNLLTKPINTLVLAMQEMKAGKYDIELSTRRKDEIGNLNSAFNYMTSEIDRLVHQVYENKLRLQNAELKELQAQINPHFLYNSLESINWILIDKGDYETSEIIRSLASLLRYSTQSHNNLVPLKEEIEFVESYLKIQKYRLEDKLNFSITIPNNLLDYLVPKLILQPLVENAVIHGAIPSKYPSEINIIAYMDKNLSIVIKDDGVGIGQKWIDNIDAAQNVEDSTAHTGMINVHRRLKLQYGEEYGITANRSENGGTIITILLPLDD